MIENELYAPLAAVTHVLCGVPTAILPTAALAALSVCSKGCRAAAANELERRSKAIDDGEYVAKDGTLCEPHLIRMAYARGRLNHRSLRAYARESAKRGFVEGAMTAVDLCYAWIVDNYSTTDRLPSSELDYVPALVASLGTKEMARAVTERHKPCNDNRGAYNYYRLMYTEGLFRYWCDLELSYNLETGHLGCYGDYVRELWDRAHRQALSGALGRARTLCVDPLRGKPWDTCGDADEKHAEPRGSIKDTIYSMNYEYMISWWGGCLQDNPHFDTPETLYVINEWSLRHLKQFEER